MASIAYDKSLFFRWSRCPGIGWSACSGIAWSAYSGIGWSVSPVFPDYQRQVGRNTQIDQKLTNSWDRGYQTRAINPNSSYFFITESIYNAVSTNVLQSNFINIGNLLRQHYGSVPNSGWRPQLISSACYNDILNLVPFPS
jgi:hypothetical protein